MTTIVFGISFILIWLVTTFFIVRYMKKLKDDLLKKFSDTEKPSEEKSENIREEDEEKGGRPFDFVRRADPERIFIFIRHEHPQIIALILAYMEPHKASLILHKFPSELQSDVSRRIAVMNSVSPEILREIERVLEKKLSTITSEHYIGAGGVDSVVEILHCVDSDSEKKIIKSLEGEDPDLAEEIKKRMFVFEDIVMLDDSSIQKVICEVDSQEFVKALKSVDSEVQNKVFRNMSKRASSKLKKDLEHIGPVRLKDVEEAQQKIVSIINRLVDTGKIVIARCGEDEFVV